jgi:signal transduction histidine kinase
MRFRGGIQKKLFIVTSIVFFLFITTNLVLNSLFFQKFYENKKKSEIHSLSLKFKKEYSNLKDLENADKLIKEYEDENRVKIIILTSSNNLITSNKLQYSKGDITRSKMHTQFVYDWISDYENLLTLNNKEFTTVIPKDLKDYGGRELINISKSQNGKDIIFIMYSLQPVNDAASTMREFYMYSYVFAIVFIIILSIIFSKMISKPLVIISDTATKMSKLDFNTKCEVKTKDEFENVASSLNFLSQNLNNALNSLKEANEKLEQDIEKERNLEKMRKEFVAAVSHELKTPIALIDGYAVGLKDEIFEGEDKDFYLNIIIDEARKMGGLVGDMLELSHLESGNYKLIKENFNLGELIKSTTKKYSTMISDKEVSLELNLFDVDIYGDIGRIEQVLTNFIINAIKHVKSNGTIKINMEKQEDGIKVEMENTGDKIPEEEKELIWNKFYKIDKSRNRKEGGTGLGLSITKNILELHGFRYGVENTNEGVRFYFIAK